MYYPPTMYYLPTPFFGQKLCGRVFIIQYPPTLYHGNAPCTGNDNCRQVTNFSHVDGFENSRFWNSSLHRQLQLLIEKFSLQNKLLIKRKNFFAVHSIHEIFLKVDSYNMNRNQMSLAVMLWLSGVVIDQAFISGGVDVRTETYLLIIAA